MKVISINSTYRPKNTTTQLAKSALDGAASVGAETEMIILKEYNIENCRNCLSCYQDLGDEIPPCPINDDLDKVMDKIVKADGIIFASPLHMAHFTASMMNLLERLCFRLCRPTGSIMGIPMCPEIRKKDKVRGMGIIINAGGMPKAFRKLCDQATPFLKENAGAAINARCVGDIYAEAVLTKKPTKEDFQRIFLLRKITKDQLKEAFDLGVKLATLIKNNKLKPFDLVASMGPFGSIVNSLGKVATRLYNFWKIAP